MDGVFSAGKTATLFHEALDLTEVDVQRVQAQVCWRVLACLARRGFLDEVVVAKAPAGSDRRHSVWCRCIKPVGTLAAVDGGDGGDERVTPGFPWKWACAHIDSGTRLIRG